MRIVIFIVFIQFTHLLNAQWRIAEIAPRKTQATVLDRTLTLPFWEDFSVSGPTPDTLLWQDSDNVFVNDALGLNAPTYKTASFDGLQENGRAYKINGTVTAPTDSLTSHFIDLSTLSPSDSLYISFFWQAGGNGEMPEERDSLVLKFYNGKVWNNVWSMIGGATNVHENFKQKLLPIKDTTYFKSDFKFKFVAYGRQSGPFDTWHLDYIYLNKNRTKGDSTYLDRALSGKMSAPFAPFNSIPAKVFYSDPARFLKPQSIIAVNLDASAQPVDLFYFLDNIVDSVLLKKSQNLLDAALIKYTIKPIDTLQLKELKESLAVFAEKIKSVEIGLNANSSVDATSSAILGFDKYNNKLDSQVIQISFVLISADQNIKYKKAHNDSISNINLKSNDIIKNQYLLQDFYAYDDGGAEFAVGIKEKFGKIAVRYVIPESDTLTHIDIHFPHIAPSTDSTEITIMVWNKLDEESIFHSQKYRITASTARNQFQRIQLNKQKVVKDTIYIGFQQLSNEYVPIGFDRNSPVAKDQIFYKTGQSWIQNEDLNGALMIRPVFAKAGEIILSTELAVAKNTVYPNPTNGSFMISGEYEHVEIYTLSGAKIYASDHQIKHELNVNKGLYLVKIQTKNGVQMRKLIVE
jgi:hypothetical protein